MKSLILLLLAFCLVESQYSWNGTTWVWKEGSGQNKPIIEVVISLYFYTSVTSTILIFQGNNYDDYAGSGAEFYDNYDDTEIDYEDKVQPKEQLNSTTTETPSTTMTSAVKSDKEETTTSASDSA